MIYKTILTLGLLASSLFAGQADCENINASDRGFLRHLDRTTGCLPRPIIFVHGLGSDRNFWKQNSPYSAVYEIIKEFDLPHGEVHGVVAWWSHIPHIGIDFFNGSKLNTDSKNNIEYQTPELYAQLITTLNTYYGDTWKSDLTKKIDLVTHSQGALVTRNMIKEYRNATDSNAVNHINIIINMNAPHLGSDFVAERSEYYSVRHFTKHLKNILSREDIQIPRQYKEEIEKLLDKKYLGVDSDYLNQLNAEGVPTYPHNGKKIPVGLMYTTAPNMLEYSVDYAIELNNAVCRIKDAELETGGDWWDDYFFEPAFDVYEAIWDVSVSGGLSAINGEWTWYTLDDQYQATCRQGIKLPLNAFYNWFGYKFDEPGEWSENSDAVVSKNSQMGIGLFNPNTDPVVYYNINLEPFPGEDVQIPTIPHSNFFGLKGPESYGLALIEAMKRVNALPEQNHNIVPTIITPLLLN